MDERIAQFFSSITNATNPEDLLHRLSRSALSMTTELGYHDFLEDKPMNPKRTLPPEEEALIREAITRVREAYKAKEDAEENLSTTIASLEPRSMEKLAAVAYLRGRIHAEIERAEEAERPKPDDSDEEDEVAVVGIVGLGPDSEDVIDEPFDAPEEDAKPVPEPEPVTEEVKS